MSATTEARQAPTPPIDAEFYFQDERGRPCSPATSYRWCWAGGPQWYRSAEYSPPGATRRGRKRATR